MLGFPFAPSVCDKFLPCGMFSNELTFATRVTGKLHKCVKSSPKICSPFQNHRITIVYGHNFNHCHCFAELCVILDRIKSRYSVVWPFFCISEDDISTLFMSFPSLIFVPSLFESNICNTPHFTSDVLHVWFSDS